MTNTITMPRSVVEQALEALESGIQYDYHGNPYSDNDAARCVASDALRAALDQQQAERVGGWKLVPTSMTDEMAAAEHKACLEIADLCADADMHASMAANAIRARSQE